MSLILAAVLASHPVPPPHPAELAGMLEGRWDNAAQIEAESDPSGPHLHVRHEILAGGDFAGVPVYAELRVGGPRGEVYRQRVYVISPASGGYDMDMAVYEFAEAGDYAGASGDALGSIGREDLIRFDSGCDFLWRQTAGGWDGAIEDGACVRTSSRSGRDLIIGAQFTIRDDVFTHSESGRFADGGEAVFGPPDGEPNVYDRVE